MSPPALSQGHPTTLEDFISVLISVKEDQWAAEWEFKDWCLVLVNRFGAGSDFLRAIAEGLGTSHWNLERAANVALRFPASERMKDRSPRTHVSEAKRMVKP